MTNLTLVLVKWHVLPRTLFRQFVLDDTRQRDHFITAITSAVDDSTTINTSFEHSLHFRSLSRAAVSCHGSVYIVQRWRARGLGSCLRSVSYWTWEWPLVKVTLTRFAGTIWPLALKITRTRTNEPSCYAMEKKIQRAPCTSETALGAFHRMNPGTCGTWRVRLRREISFKSTLVKRTWPSDLLMIPAKYSIPLLFINNNILYMHASIPRSVLNGCIIKRKFGARKRQAKKSRMQEHD